MAQEQKSSPQAQGQNTQNAQGKNQVQQVNLNAAIPAQIANAKKIQGNSVSALGSGSIGSKAQNKPQIVQGNKAQNKVQQNKPKAQAKNNAAQNNKKQNSLFPETGGQMNKNAKSASQKNQKVSSINPNARSSNNNAQSGQSSKKAQGASSWFNNEYAGSAEQFAQAAQAQTQALSKNFEELAAIQQKTLDALTESCTIGNEVTEAVFNQVSKSVNRLVSSQSAAVEELLACKTANDFFSAQSNYTKNWLDNSFDAAAKISEICLRYSEAGAPLNEQVSKNNAQFSKIVANSAKK